MPRKTRQQKMAAKLHRMEKQLGESEPIEDDSIGSKKQDTDKPTSYSLRDIKLTKTEKFPEKALNTDVGTYDYVMADVRKIIVLSAIAVAAEIALSLTINSQFAKLLLSRFGIEI